MHADHVGLALSRSLMPSPFTMRPHSGRLNCLLIMMTLSLTAVTLCSAMRAPREGHEATIRSITTSSWPEEVAELCRSLMAGTEQPESGIKLISWANLAALQPSYGAHQLTAQPTPQAGLDQMEADLQAEHDVASRITKLAAYIAAKHHISNADALAICAAVGLEQLSQVNILSYGQGLRVGRLDVPAAAQAPTTQGCPVEQFKALMHKLNLLDDKGTVKPEAYLAALEAAGTFPEGQAPAYASFQAQHQQVSRRRLTQVFWTSFFKIFAAAPPPPPPPPSTNVFASSWTAWSKLWPRPYVAPPAIVQQKPPPPPPPVVQNKYPPPPPPVIQNKYPPPPPPVIQNKYPPPPPPVIQMKPPPPPPPPVQNKRPPPPVFIPKPVYAPPPAMALKAPPPPWYSYFFKRPPPPAFFVKAPPPPPAFVAKAPPPPPVFVAKAPPPSIVVAAAEPPPPVKVAKYPPPPPVVVADPPPPPPVVVADPPPPPPVVVADPPPPPPVVVADPPPPPPVVVADPPPPPPVVVADPPPPPPVVVADPPPPPVAVPPSPYSIPASVCVTPTSGSINVGGFPSSAFPLFPFTRPFTNPDRAQVSTTGCGPANGQCIDGYEIDVKQMDLNLHVGCPAGLNTTVLTYNGTVPGPYFDIPTGTQSIVRFNNLIPADSVRYPEFDPCDPANGRRGRPISVHLHGSASLAPYDGFAADETCSGETKDYIYPNNRPTTLWYHDHALDITGDNAHAGLAGMYIVRDDSRWGLAGMQEYLLQLTDRVMDASCQFVFDTLGAHEENHYGDINLVSGHPFPVISLEPKWIRFRLNNAALARPWLLTIRDDQGKAVLSTGMCHVIAGDGGYRRTPIPFPAGGLYIGVAERYEFVCDFSQVKGRTLILWNHQDTDRMKDVPFFCHSHLVAQIVVAADCAGDPGCGQAPEFNPFGDAIPTQVEKDFATPAEFTTATNFALAGGCHRTFVFERRLGQWTINGETWHTVRIAASDVGSNAWEVWCLEGKGGWFHPIHIHLIDFFVMKRYPQGAYQTLEPFEAEVPKDVVVLHPGAKVAGLAKWGPHRGEYMFHCHNLRHEDTAMLRTFVTGRIQPANAVGQAAETIALNNFQFTFVQNQLYDSYAQPLTADAIALPTSAVQPFTSAYLGQKADLEVYRLFYPGVLDNTTLLCNRNINPWLVNDC